MQTDEKHERKQNLLKGLALSWDMRAMGKGSHAGFNTCMENIRDIVPDDVWNRISKANLHFHDPLEKWVKEMQNEIPKEIRNLTGGDTPSLARLQGLIDELEGVD